MKRERGDPWLCACKNCLAGEAFLARVVSVVIGVPLSAFFMLAIIVGWSKCHG